MKYHDWMEHVSDDTVKHILKTVSHILDESDSELTETELNKLHKSWKIIDIIHHMHEDENTGTNSNTGIKFLNNSAVNK